MENANGKVNDVERGAFLLNQVTKNENEKQAILSAPKDNRSNIETTSFNELHTRVLDCEDENDSESLQRMLRS